MILLVVKSFLSLIALFPVTAVIHEGAHYTAAVIMNVPIASFTWFDRGYLTAVFVSGGTEYAWRVMVVSYAGGLVTGVLLLATLVFKRDWFRRSLYRWLLGFYMAMFGFWHLCQGILEGAFHDMYIADASNFLSLSYGIGYGSALLGMALYWVFMPSVRSVMAKAKSTKVFSQSLH